jgi:hypothetical protein
MAVYYVGERVGRYDRYNRAKRKNVNRWMIPQPVKRRSNREYKPVYDSAYWPCAILTTIIAVVLFFVVWWIAG